MRQTQASVSHNMRTPVETVTLISRTLLQQRQDDLFNEENGQGGSSRESGKEIEMLKGIANASGLMGFLMDDLLDR